MRILITGSEGVLGLALQEALKIQGGHEVFGCDLVHKEQSSYMRADISERRQLEKVFDAFEPQLVYNFAAEFGRKNGQEYYEQLWKSNCLGTRNVIEECVKHKAVLAHASSSEAYGLSEQYANGDLHEGLLDKFPPQFHNEYALTKYTNEKQISLAVRNDGLKAVIFRFFNVYGPPEKFSPYRSVVCQLAYKLLAGLPITVTKDGYRSHLWIGDWAYAVSNLPKVLDQMLSIKYWAGSGGTFNTPVLNIGGDDYTSIEELYNMLVDIIQPKNPDVTFVETEKNNSAAKKPDNDLSKNWLDYRLTTPLKEGLYITVQHLKAFYGF